MKNKSKKILWWGNCSAVEGKLYSSARISVYTLISRNQQPPYNRGDFGSLVGK